MTKLVKVLRVPPSLPLALLLSVLPISTWATRVVSTSPQVTELLFQLGKGNDVVGTTSFSDYPDAAKLIPIIGPLTSPGVEAVVAIRPDWVIIDPTYGIQNFERAMRVQHISVFPWKVRSVDELLEQAQRFLQEVYGESQNKNLFQWQTRIAELRATKFPKRRAIIFAWHNPAIIASQSSFLSDLLSLAGIENVMTKGKTDFVSVSPEWLMTHKPDLVFFLGFGTAFPSDFKSSLIRLWPTGDVQTIFLPSDKFARATFTSFDSLGNVLTLLSGGPK